MIEMIPAVVLVKEETTSRMLPVSFDIIGETDYENRPNNKIRYQSAGSAMLSYPIGCKTSRRKDKISTGNEGVALFL
ncbi:hypothetical protein [Methanoregula sp.]|uniref:hypothetical protein n=1 Tax=Methanoregula sp. TaxID=2052170 RepID=UPI00356A56E9